MLRAVALMFEVEGKTDVAAIASKTHRDMNAQSRADFARKVSWALARRVDFAYRIGFRHWRNSGRSDEISQILRRGPLFGPDRGTSGHAIRPA
jgi:hypothetical protein